MKLGQTSAATLDEAFAESRNPAAPYIARMADAQHEELARTAATPGVTMLIGGLDTGKTTVAVDAVRYALASGHTPVLVDADIGISTVGPPACVGMRVFSDEADLETLHAPDGLHFVGAITAAKLVLQLVVATAVMVEKARNYGNVIIIDTTAVASGVSGETLKYHKAELCRPDRVIALQRGEEMEPVVGMLRRFLDLEVITAPTDPGLNPLGPDERAHKRAEAFAKALQPPLERWKVRPTVFAPTLPVGLNLGRLDNVLVGVQDASGGCLGLGVLRVEEDTLRVVTNVGDGMTGLRLGSLRLDPETFDGTAISLRELMFGV
jgi:polynucleotide 5'-kinase involved in rRNA processing